MKLINGESCQTYYRSTSLSNLYLNFLKTSFFEFEISESAFYTFLPKWLLTRRKYEGLCKICFIAYFYAKQLRLFRMQIHKDCTYTCTLCTQCSHGQGL